MAYEFTENLVLALPDAGKKVKELTEAEGSRRNKILTEIAAIHVGLTANFNMYTEEALEASLTTWIDPYPRPIIVNHDEYSEPLGRVMAAKMDKESDGTPYIAIQAAIINPDTVEKVLDERYITGSVGGKADSAKCSICGIDWAKESGGGLPCRHKRGKVYEGKLAYLEFSEITWREYSFVNIPADKQSQLKSVSNTLESDIHDSESSDWVRPIKMYSLDMDQEAIWDLNENSDTASNILESLKRSDRAFTYINVKGTFLTTTALDIKESLEKEDKEKITFIQKDNTIEGETAGNAANIASEEKDVMTKLDETVQDEDILSVAENLRADSISDENEDVSAEENNSEDDTDPGESSDSADNQETDPAVVSEDDAEPEVQEDANLPAADDDADNQANEEEASDDETDSHPLEGSDDNEPSDDVDDLLEEKIDTDEEVDNQSDDTTDKVEESEDSEELQAEVNQLKEDNDRLKEENGKLKAHLHYMLAERVVDTKIAVGLVAAENRKEAVADHEQRTPSSLADALKDLQEYEVVAPKQTAGANDLMNVKSHGVGSENSVIETDEAEEDQDSKNSMSDEDLAVMYLSEALLGKKKL